MPTTVAGTSITYNDSTVQSTAYIGGRSTIYTSGTNTFTVPTGVTALKVTVIGGGGGGGGAKGGGCVGGTGGQGGAGGVSIRWITGQTPGSTITATVGAGGTAGTTTPTAGGSGGTSSFGAFASATGGGGGGAGNATAGSSGSMGTGSSGDINLTGYSLAASTTMAGIFCTPATIPSSGTYNGVQGAGFGGGGSGGATNFGDGTNPRAGAAGLSGIIIIEY